MKITKGKSIAASRNPATEVEDKDIQQAKEQIKCAINTLGKSAIKGNAQAKSAIADLSVILLSMK